MYSTLDGVYDAFTELMYYFYFEFNIYCFLVLIVFINCIKTIQDYLYIKKNNSTNINLSPCPYTLIVSVFAGISLYNALMFQGVLADISEKYSHIWINKIFTLSIIAFTLFIIQLYFFAISLKTKK